VFGARASILRIGQIVPSRGEGGGKLWNANEVIPLIVRSVNFCGALPDRLGRGDTCGWVEVGVVASAVVDSCHFICDDSGECEGSLLYNIVHPRSFSWKDGFLPRLREAGISFEIVGFNEWLERLKWSERDVEKNPSSFLFGFWEEQERKTVVAKLILILQPRRECAKL
jgi:hypothetical protein